MAEFEKSLERYDVLDRIAVGGMAEVFLAKAYGAHGFEKTLAIKRILPELARDPEFEERFIAEAKVAVKLSHTNIVQVLDFGRFSGSLFIAMEYVDGLDLAALLRRHKELGRQIPLPSAFQIAIELARGLDFAHQHGVVHRDVSPSNILLSRAGEVKIADFGIAVAARPHRSRSGTGPRKVMGKWRYMSPEQATGEVLDTRSDLFSAAAVMFELFTGAKLFGGDEVDEIVRNIQSMPIPSLRSIRPELPAQLDEILAGPLSRKPSDRPQRAALLVRALTELSYESSIVATSLDVAEVVGSVLGPSTAGRPNLDDMIRAQLGTAAGEHGADNAITRERRQTAVGGDTSKGGSTATTALREGTGVFVHVVDGDGVSRLESDELTMASQPRSRRITAPPGDAPDSDAEKSVVVERNLPAARADDADLDRHTQVGPPLDESRPIVKYSKLLLDLPITPDSAAVAVVENAAPLSAPQTAPGNATSRRWPLVAVLLVFVAGVAAVLLLWQRGGVPSVPDAQIVTPVIVDAVPAPTTGVLEIDSEPSGARGSVGEQTFDTTPTRITVAAGQPLRLTLERERYQPYVDDGIVVGPGQVVRIRAALTPSKSTLVVTSNPVGAQVTLDGRRLGETPLRRSDLDPRESGRLTLSHNGFVSWSTKVELVFGETTTIERELKAEQQFGEIRIAVMQDGRAGWADAYVRGKKVGRASVTDAPLRLPVGRHSLRLVNPVTGAAMVLEVDIVVGKNPSRTARLER